MRVGALRRWESMALDVYIRIAPQWAFFASAFINKVVKVRADEDYNEAKKERSIVVIGKRRRAWHISP
jgi:hypothetical protein